jgi:PfaD family protein
LYPEWLGDRSFCATHNTRFAYVTGAMANGIAAVPLVKAMAEAQLLGFFGAAGLSLQRIEHALQELASLGDLPYGCNLIHAPHEPLIEAGTVDLLLHYGVRRAEAAAFMSLTQPVVRYALSGIRQLPDGSIYRKNSLFAKISRPEVAKRFLSPAPVEILQALVRAGQLTEEEARLARLLPIAEDITVESDSGGHTDNRPLSALFPLIAALRDDCCQEFGYSRPVRVGAAGGIGTPMAVAAAFALGAAYVVTGSINQASIEAGTSLLSKELLAKADIADIAMAPAADMFELGVEVQVLKRGTLFASRAHRLYSLYNRYESLEAIPVAERDKLEREIFRAPLSDIWASTARFFEERNPDELKKAASDAHHRMALVFRWYLGQASKWAIAGEPGRVMDYQIWCGPAQGAFNAWAKGSFLEPLASRSVVQLALNLLEGAASISRASQLRSFGLQIPPEAFTFAPRYFEVTR